MSGLKSVNDWRLMVDSKLMTDMTRLGQANLERLVAKVVQLPALAALARSKRQMYHVAADWDSSARKW